MRIALLSLCWFGLATSAAAQPATDSNPTVLDQVYACSSVSGEAERLACYDGAVGRLREAQTSGNLVAIDRATAQNIQREAFGYSLPDLPRIFGGNGATDDVVEEMRMEIATVTSGRGGVGRTTFTMTNGQVWVLTDQARNSTARPGASVTIRAAALGSYLMSLDRGAALRVRRVE